MNRVARQSLAPQLIEALRSAHAGFISATGKKVPPSVVSLYAAPEVAADGVVHWTTSLQGNPVAFKDLPTERLEAFKALLFQKLAAVASLAKELSAEPAKYAKEISLLKQAAAAPAVDAIYSVNGQPVLLYWASSLPPDPNRKMLALPVSATAVAAVPSSSLSPKVRWLLALLLFLLFLFLLWWFFCPKSPRNDVGSNTPAPVSLSTPSTKSIPPATAPEEKAVPPVALKPIDPPLKEPEPPLVEVPEPEAELLRPRTPPPEPVAPEVVAPTPDVVPPKVAAPVKPPVPQTITVDNAKDVCPEDRPAALAPEMIVVFDASGSMRVNISATAADERWAFQMMHGDPNFIASKLSPSDVQKFYRLWPLHTMTEAEREWLYKVLIAHTPGRLSPGDRQRFLRLVGEPTRIASAKQATINVIQRLPKDAGTGLVVVDRCTNGASGARNLGRFAPNQRGQMLSRLNNLTPFEGTPLADGLLQGGELADGVTRESTILLVSDGAESCGGDPCFVARNLKRNKPHLKINVIDIGGTGAANCAAELTGGKVYTVSNVNELNLGIERAAQDTLGPAHCRKPN